MFKVKFVNIGSENKNWEAECDLVTYDWLYGQVKKQGALLSSDLYFLENGSILAGFRTVGSFKIEELKIPAMQ